MLDDVIPINICDEDGWTALHLASWSNKKYVVELLKNVADINAQNKDGTTPLHHAARRNSTEAISVLLQHDALRNIITRIAHLNILHILLRSRSDAPDEPALSKCFFKLQW